MGDLSVAVTGQKAESAIILTAQLMASGILGVRGAAALSPAMADGRGEPGCVREQRRPGSSVMETEKKSENAATNAVQHRMRFVPRTMPCQWCGDGPLQENSPLIDAHLMPQAPLVDAALWITVVWPSGSSLAMRDA